MSVKFKDYYETLGVSRDASRDDIQRAYRKLARKYHPDLNKSAGSEDRFKEINEAYEVLKDPEKRQKYDQLGSNWQDGDNFRPPPGWEYNSAFGSGPQGRRENFVWSSQGGDFSDFFETLFGGQFREGYQGSQGTRPFSRQQRGSDHEAILKIPLEEAFHGGKKTITMQGAEPSADGNVSIREKRYDVKIRR